MDSSRKKSLNEFIAVLKELVADGSATDGGSRHSIERARLCEYTYIEDFSIDHFKDPKSKEEKLVLEGLEDFKNFEQCVTIRSCE